MRRSMLATLACAGGLLITGICSPVAGRANAISAERSALAQRSAGGSRLTSNFFGRASAIIDLAGRTYSFVDYYGGDSYGARGRLPEPAQPTDQIVERVNQDLARLGRMSPARPAEAASADVAGVENPAVGHAEPIDPD